MGLSERERVLGGGGGWVGRGRKRMKLVRVGTGSESPFVPHFFL